MTREDFFELLGELDDDTVETAIEPGKRRAALRFLAPIAACLVLAAALLIPKVRPVYDGGSLDGDPGGYAQSGELAPMVCVGRGLYQIALYQPELSGREDELVYLGEITGRVDSAERPRRSFQANDDLIGSRVYRLDEDIVVEYEGKYLLYELVYNYQRQEG